MRTLTKVLTKFLFIVLIALSFFGFSSTKPLAQTEAVPTFKVKVAIYQNPPKVYRDTDGTVKGFWPDIINYIAKQNNWSVEYVDGAFEEGLMRVKSNEVDLMPDVGFTPERAAVYAFTEETGFISWATVYSKTGTDISAFSDLRGKRIAVLEGDIHFVGPLGIQKLMSSFGYEANYVVVPSYEDTFKAVSTGAADVAVVNRIFGEVTAEKYDVKITSLIFNPVELKFILPKEGKNTKYLADTLDKDLHLMKADEESVYYHSLIGNLEGTISQVEIIPKWIAPLLMGIGTIALIAILITLLTRRYQYVLEHRVQEKTAALLKSETKFKELTDLLPQTIFETNMDGVITYVNDFTSKAFGYSKEQLLDNVKLEKLFSEKTEVPVKNFQYFSTLDLAPLKFEGRKKDGTTFPAYLYASIIRDGADLNGLRGVIIDLTEQKQIQDKLNQKVTELEALIQMTISREIQMEDLKKQIKQISKT